MTNTRKLNILINSLTKAEKRYFKLHSDLQSGKKDYLILFELFDGGVNVDDIEAEFSKRTGATSFEIASKYLLKKILNFLVYLKMDKDKEAEFFFNILKADILFEKTLYEDSIALLGKVEKEARVHELYLHEIFAIKKELYYLDNLNYYEVTEQDIIQRHSRMRQAITNFRNIQLHSSLYELLKQRLVSKGSARSIEDKENLSHLVVQELNLLSNPIANTFESKKLHLLFQANYFISINDYKSAGKLFTELNVLLENHKYLWENSPIYYLNMVEGILKSLHSIQQYDEILVYLKKLEATVVKTLHTEILIQRLFFIYGLLTLANTGKLEDALLLVEQFDEKLFQKLHLLDLDKQAEIYLYTAIIYLYNRQPEKSHCFLNKVLIENALFFNLPIYQTFRLIRLIVYYEREQFDVISYEIRSIKRKFKALKTKSHLLEKIVFKFILLTPLPAGKNMRNKLWEQVSESFKTIKGDKYESQLLHIFDFESWIRSKLMKTPVAECIKEKTFLKTG